MTQPTIGRTYTRTTADGRKVRRTVVSISEFVGVDSYVQYTIPRGEFRLTSMEKWALWARGAE